MRSIKSLSLQLRIERWQDVDAILKGYLWSDKIDILTARMLWQEVEACC